MHGLFGDVTLCIHLCVLHSVRITQVINTNAYRLDIPLHWKIHNSFHIRLSRKFKGNPPAVPIIEDPTLLEDDDKLLIPKSIVDHDLTTTHTGIEYHQYLVKYKNDSLEKCQWLPTSSLSPTYQHLIFAYHTHTRSNNE